MKKFIQVILSLSPFICQAQFANVWCFGRNEGLDFNNGSPSYISYTGIKNIKGSTSICDSSGQLLFYTDGGSVWNKQHLQMPNGDSLGFVRYLYVDTIIGALDSAYASAYQSAIIIPIENSNRYYIFTADYYLNSPHQLKYHIVDMDLNNGLGDLILKNQILQTDISESVTAVRHCNGIDWWIVCHKAHSNEFLSILVKPDTIINSPIVSYIGTYTPTFDNLFAISKVSPNGKWIATVYGTRGIELSHFNNSTGEILYFFDDFNFWKTSFGCTFSADSKYLFASVMQTDSIIIDSLTGNNILYHFVNRYNISAPDSFAIMQSKIQLISPENAFEWSSMQLAPDNNIYVKASLRDSLNTIATAGDAIFKIKIDSDTIFATPFSSYRPLFTFYVGLPSFPDAIFTNLHKASLRIPTCMSGVFDSIPFYDSLLTTTRDYIWDFGDPASGINNTYNGQFPIHTFSSAGTYTVTLTLPSDCNPLSISQQVTAYPLTAAIPNINLNSNFLECTPASTYQWYLNNNLIVGATNQTYTPITNGDYTVTITDSNNCSQTSSIYNFAVMGINISNPNNFSIYPNPANNHIQINNPTQIQSKITISDLLGNIIVQSYITKQIESINTNQLSNGIYIVNIENYFNQKLAINR